MCVCVCVCVRVCARVCLHVRVLVKGWMNEISSYDPETYHATYTHSVYVRLEGSVLRLSKPNHNIARRATHNEPKPDVSYISQKIYDLAHSKVLPRTRAHVLCMCVDVGGRFLGGFDAP